MTHDETARIERFLAVARGEVRVDRESLSAAREALARRISDLELAERRLPEARLTLLRAQELVDREIAKLAGSEARVGRLEDGDGEHTREECE